jgi:ligand-binding sensor domain-containing protein
MRFSIKLKILTATVGFLFLFSSLSSGQTYSFINYGAEKNIPSGYVYTIVQSNDGFLWVGTGNGLSRFDGYNFFPVQYPDSTVGRYATKSLKDKQGRLWFGCSDGAVLYENDNRLIKVPLSNTRSISELIEGPDGLIYAIPQGKTVFSINPLKPDKVHQYSISVEPAMLSAAFTKTGNLLIGTQENLLFCKLEKDSISVIKVIEGIDSYGITSICKIGDGSRFIIGTDDNGLFQLKISDKSNEMTRFPDHPEFNSLKIQSITKDSEGSFWVSTSGSGVIQFAMTDNYEKVSTVKFYDIRSGLSGNDIKVVFQDVEGNYWFGLYGEGISMLGSSSLSSYTPGKNSQENNILYIKNFDSNYLLGTPTGYHIFDPAAV